MIPKITLNEILNGRKPKILTTTTGKYEDGQLPIEQARILLSILTVEKPSLVVEFGTFMGHTTLLMANNLVGAEIHTIDLPQDNIETELPKDDLHLITRRVVGREFAGRTTKSDIIQHFGDSATMNMDFAEGADFFFIDGSHTYAYAKSDTIRCMVYAGKPATFLWHDCDDSHQGVVDALLYFREKGWDIRRIEGTPLAYLKL